MSTQARVRRTPRGLARTAGRGSSAMAQRLRQAVETCGALARLGIPVLGGHAHTVPAVVQADLPAGVMLWPPVAVDVEVRHG